VESVKLKKKDTMGCPSCGVRIYKIEGCDQMWCVECHTPFSYKTGDIVKGVVHNPHYYEYIREHGENNLRNPLHAKKLAQSDLPCNGSLEDLPCNGSLEDLPCNGSLMDLSAIFIIIVYCVTLSYTVYTTN